MHALLVSLLFFLFLHVAVNPVRALLLVSAQSYVSLPIHAASPDHSSPAGQTLADL